MMSGVLPVMMIGVSAAVHAVTARRPEHAPDCRLGVKGIKETDCGLVTRADGGPVFDAQDELDERSVLDTSVAHPARVL